MRRFGGFNLLAFGFLRFFLVRQLFQFLPGELDHFGQAVLDAGDLGRAISFTKELVSAVFGQGLGCLESLVDGIEDGLFIARPRPGDTSHGQSGVEDGVGPTHRRRYPVGDGRHLLHLQGHPALSQTVPGGADVSYNPLEDLLHGGLIVDDDHGVRTGFGLAFAPHRRLLHRRRVSLGVVIVSVGKQRFLTTAQYRRSLDADLFDQQDSYRGFGLLRLSDTQLSKLGLSS